MITIKNYHTEMSGLTKQDLPLTLWKGKEFVDKVTENGKSWDKYHESDTIKKTIDLFLEKLNAFFDKKGGIKKGRNQVSKPPKKKEVIKPLNPQKGNQKKPTARVRKMVPSQKPVPVAKGVSTNPQKVESIAIELKFLKRYLNLDQKAKTKRQIRLFLNALQRAIIEKKIRKTSKYANEINRLQKDLMDLLSYFKNNTIMQVVIAKRKQNQILKVLGLESEIPSIKYIREYIALQGRPIPTQKAKALHNKIGRKVNAGVISFKDKYSTQIKQVLAHLKALVQDNPIGGELVIEVRPLNGFNEHVQELKSNIQQIGRIPDNVVVNSLDLVKMKFSKLGFKDKWLRFIGNPSSHFNMMIFGRPKFGKSILAVDFAGYLAHYHGSVLYVAKEEGIDEELKQKLKSVAHPDLDTIGDLPKDLSPWDFVFLDSVNKMRLTPQDLEGLKERYPNKSFVSIFQTTKDGKFRGSQEFMHDMDVVIEVPEKGKAVQFGRYNQGGELNIFADNRH